MAATGGLEIGTLVYNAAAEPRGYFLEVPVAEHLDNITVNCTVPTLLCHHFGRAMAARGRGAIALVSSMGALQGGKVFASYFAAKAYEWILAEGLWAELGEAGVDAVAYVVGATRTENYKGQIDGSSDVGASTAGDGDASDDRRRSTSPAGGSATRPIPIEVGRHLFDVLGRGPTEFSHPDDERHAAVGAAVEPPRGGRRDERPHHRHPPLVTGPTAQPLLPPCLVGGQVGGGVVVDDVVPASDRGPSQPSRSLRSWQKNWASMVFPLKEGASSLVANQPTTRATTSGGAPLLAIPNLAMSWPIRSVAMRPGCTL